MGVSNLDEVVIVTRAKERFEYRRGGQTIVVQTRVGPIPT